MEKSVEKVVALAKISARTGAMSSPALKFTAV